MNQNPNNKKDELEFEIEDLSIDDAKIELKIDPNDIKLENSSFQTGADTSESKSGEMADNSKEDNIDQTKQQDSAVSSDDLFIDESDDTQYKSDKNDSDDQNLDESDDQGQTDQDENKSEDTQGNADKKDNDDQNPVESDDDKTQDDKKGDSNSDESHKDDEKKSENDKNEHSDNPNNSSDNNDAKKNDQGENKPKEDSENNSSNKDKNGDNKSNKENGGGNKGDNNTQPKTGLDKKRDDLKNKWDNRPKNAKDMKDRIKNGAKNRAKNFANRTKEDAKEGFKNSNLGQSIDKAKNVIDKGKKVVNGATKAGKVVAKAGKTASNIIKVVVASWPIMLTVILIIVLCACIFALLPGTNGDTNVELSNYSKADQKTIQKIRKLFSKYPNADATLVMATVVYPYNNILWSNDTINLASKKYSEDLEDENLEGYEEDDDTEEITKEDSDKIADDVYLDLFKKASYRKKLKTLLKKYNNEGVDSYYEHLKNTYFFEDKGYKSMFDGSPNVDALKYSIIEDLKNKKDLFINYVYNNTFCSVSFQSAGTVEIDDLLKSNVLVDVKVESCTTGKDVQNCESKYSSPLTLDKYVMSVTYEEIGVSANSDIEKVKTQMVAAKSYVLSRWKSMDWEISKTEDGSYIIPIRSNTNDQDFCDIDTGCEDKLKGAKRPAIDEATRALMVKAWDETKNLFIYDEKEAQTIGTYCANRSGVCSGCSKGTCLSHDELGNYRSGTLYTTMLGEQYSDLSLITVEGDFASVSVPGNVTCTSGNLGAHGVPDELFTYYYQTDYPNVAFCGSTDWTEGCYSNPTGKNTICTSGCGVTSLAMIVSTLSDEKLDPIMANDEATARKACSPGAGSNDSIFTNMSNNHSGFEVKGVEVSKSGADEIISALKNGALVAVNVQAQSPFTKGGHWIVIRGIASNGEVKVADPFSKEKTTSSTYNIYNFVDENWLVDTNGNKHNWYIIYGPKSPLYATKLSSTADPGVATGYLGNPTDPNNTTRSYVNDGNSRTFPKYSGGDCHGGVDLPNSVGTTIYAMDGGVVTKVGDYSSNCHNNKSMCDKGWNSYGIYVEIDHQNGYKTVYAHFSKRIVNVGDVIAKGQLIGYSGDTGDSTGPHLHLELQNTELLNANGRDAAKCTVGKGLINPALYINSETTYVGQTN